MWLRAMQNGAIPVPPAAATFGFDIDTVEDGRVAFSAAAHEWMSNPAGVVHGGMTSALLDTVLTLAVTTKLPLQKMCTTADLHVRFVRPILPDSSRFRAEGVAVHVGRTLCTAEGKVFDARGRLVAHGTGSFAVLDIPSLST